MRCEFGLMALLALVAIATAAAAAQDNIGDDVQKRSAEDPEVEELGLLDDDDVMDKRGRLFRYGRGGLFRYGKRAPVFRYGKRAPVFRYGKRSDDEEDEEYLTDLQNAKRLFRWGKRSDDVDEVKRLFRWGKRSEDEDEDEVNAEKRRIFRYGKRAPEDAKRRVFRFGKRLDYGSDAYKYGRDTRVPDQPHVPFRFGEE